MPRRKRPGDEESIDSAPVHARLPARLTERERRAELRTQEAVIERFRRAGLEAGLALEVIRAQRLYRGMRVPTPERGDIEIRTFVMYCRLRWGFDAPRARQLIGGARAAGWLEERTGIKASNELQVRPLIRLINNPETEEMAMDAWRRASQSAALTERTVREAIEELMPEPEPTPTPAPEPQPAPEPTAVEESAAEIPPSDGTEITGITSLIAEIEHAFESALELIYRSHYRTVLEDEERRSLREAFGEIIGLLEVVMKVL